METENQIKETLCTVKNKPETENSKTIKPMFSQPSGNTKSQLKVLENSSLKFQLTFVKGD